MRNFGPLFLQSENCLCNITDKRRVVLNAFKSTPHTSDQTRPNSTKPGTERLNSNLPNVINETSVNLTQSDLTYLNTAENKPTTAEPNAARAISDCTTTLHHIGMHKTRPNGCGDTIRDRKRRYPTRRDETKEVSACGRPRLTRREGPATCQMSKDETRSKVTKNE